MIMHSCSVRTLNASCVLVQIVMQQQMLEKYERMMNEQQRAKMMAEYALHNQGQSVCDVMTLRARDERAAARQDDGGVRAPQPRSVCVCVRV